MSAGRRGPHASARVLVEVQTRCALDFGVFTLDAVEEDVAYSRVGVGEESVAAWTIFVGLGGLCVEEKWISLVTSYRNEIY